MAFDLLDYTMATEEPVWLTLDSAWVQHLPMVPVLMKLLQPRTFVELGTHVGDSYMGFCQAVASQGLETRCTAVDTWKGDAQSGHYSSRVLESLRAAHDPRYGNFSRLYQGFFDDAAKETPAGSVDLLHIDGLHTYEAVKHDYETWLPKLSDRGVVLFHDTEVREPTFGVWQFWEEISAGRPQFNVPYGSGLGMLAVGSAAPAEFLAFLDELQRDSKRILAWFGAVGRRHEAKRDEGVLALAATNCQVQVNRWRQFVGQPLNNTTPSVELAMKSPKPVAMLLMEEAKQMVNEAMGVGQEVMRLRAGNK